MSYEIEYNRKVFKRENGDARDVDLAYFTKHGCNNVHPRPKDWTLDAYGWNYRVIQTVCEAAGYCEGGSLQTPRGYISPEDYLARARRAIKAAKPLTVENLTKELGMTHLSIALKPKADWLKVTAYDKEKYLPTLIEWIKDAGEGRFYFGDYRSYQQPFVSIEQFDTWRDLSYFVKKIGGYVDIRTS